MAAFFVASASVLKQAKRVTAGSWEEAIGLCATEEQGSGQYVAIPVVEVKPGKVVLDGRPGATVTPGNPV